MKLSRLPQFIVLLLTFICFPGHLSAQDLETARNSSEDSSKEQQADNDRPKVTKQVLVEKFLRRLDSPDMETRLNAGLALLDNATSEQTPMLVRTLKRGNNSDKQRFIIKTLGKLADKRAGEALRFELKHGDTLTKRAAVTALGKMDYDWPVPALARVLRQSDDPELCKRAASALGRIGSKNAQYALRSSLGKLENKLGCKNAALWALSVMRSEINPERIDTELTAGRRLQVFYKGQKYFLYHPTVRLRSGETKEGLRPWLLVCIHDSDLRAEEMFNICWKSAKKRQMAVLVPYFDNMAFPEYGSFNYWEDTRADKRLIELIAHVGEYASVNTKEVYLFGYGQGGDFIQRFVMAHPQRIAKAAFESNNFTKPDTELLYPVGVGANPMAPDIKIELYDFIKADSLLVMRSSSPTLKNAREFFASVKHFAEVSGIRPRLSGRRVDEVYEIWKQSETYLFSD